MPRQTPNVKIAQTRVFGAEIELHGNTFDETRARTEQQAIERGLTLVHPFDDERVIAGQGTLGLEILEQLPRAGVIVVPVGGGGLISGIAMAVKSVRPDVRVVGVQMERFAGAWQAWVRGPERGDHAMPPAAAGAGAIATVAEGIAVKTPGAHTAALIRAYVDDFVLVSEQDVEQAVFQLLEIEKTVVEGAGAAPLAAVVGHADRFRYGDVVLVLSGGNIDMMMLTWVLQRGLHRTRRLVRIAVEIADGPNGLADLTRHLADLDSTVVELEHRRLMQSSSVRSTVVEVLLQLRGEEQLEQILSALEAAGYQVDRVE